MAGGPFLGHGFGDRTLDQSGELVCLFSRAFCPSLADKANDCDPIAITTSSNPPLKQGSKSFAGAVEINVGVIFTGGVGDPGGDVAELDGGVGELEAEGLGTGVAGSVPVTEM